MRPYIRKGEVVIREWIPRKATKMSDPSAGIFDQMWSKADRIEELDDGSMYLKFTGTNRYGYNGDPLPA
eukprot:56713-Eustigmatos_ZCMA.PRE.1